MQRSTSNYQSVWNNEITKDDIENNLRVEQRFIDNINFLPTHPTKPIFKDYVSVETEPVIPISKSVYRRGTGYASLRNYNQI